MRAMMKHALMGVAALAMSEPASAADLVSAGPAPTNPTSYNWSGLYAGFGLGAGAVNHEIDLVGFSLIDGIGGEGMFGEVSLGYDHMISDRMLLGAFASYRHGNIGTDISASFGPAAGYDLTMQHGLDIGARLGFLIAPETLAYLTGGYSHQSFEASGSGVLAGLGYDWGAEGYFAGAGLETVVSGNWTAKAEYRFYQFDREDIALAGVLGVEPSAHTFVAGLNYRFGGGQAAGSAAFAPVAYDFAGLKFSAAGGFGAVVHQLDVGIAAGVLGGNPPISASFNGLGGEGMFGEIGAVYDFNLQGNWVAGIGGDYRMGNIETTAIGELLTVTADHGYDIYGRIGYKLNPDTLAYALAGYSSQHFDAGSSVAPLNAFLDQFSWTAHGWTAGAGLETAISDRWTAKIEYRYAEYDSYNVLATAGIPAAAATLDITPSIHTVRAGLTFKVF